MLDKELFVSIWEKFQNQKPKTLILDDVFSDTVGGKGLTIHLIDNVYLTVWEDGTASVADFDEG